MAPPHSKVICKCGRKGGTITVKKAGNRIMKTIGQRAITIIVNPYKRKNGREVGAGNRSNTKKENEKPVAIRRRIYKKVRIATDQRRQYFYNVHYTPEGLESCELGASSDYPLSKVSLDDSRYENDYKQTLLRFVKAEQRSELEKLFGELCSMLGSIGFPKRFIEHKVAHDTKTEIKRLKDERQHQLDKERIVYLAPFDSWAKLIPLTNDELISLKSKA